MIYIDVVFTAEALLPSLIGIVLGVEVLMQILKDNTSKSLSRMGLSWTKDKRIIIFANLGILCVVSIFGLSGYYTLSGISIVSGPAVIATGYVSIFVAALLNIVFYTMCNLFKSL